MDLAFEAVGNTGKFQKIISLLVIAVGGMSQILSISFPFMTLQPEFLCREKANLFSDFHPCHKEFLCRTDYDYIVDEANSLNNLALEFDLTCDRQSFINLFGSTFFFGGILGSVVLSAIPDKAGREKIYKVLIFLNLIAHLNMLFTNSPYHIVIVNFFAGFISYSMSMCTLILTEYIHRSVAGIVMSFHSSIFPMLGVLVTLYFIYVNNWRLFFFLTSMCSVLMAYVANKYFVESPRWLNSKNRMQECLCAFQRIAIINGTEKTLQVFMEQNTELIKSATVYLQEDKKTFSLFEIFRLKSQRTKLLYLGYMWAASGFCFYGLILNLEHLGGDIFLNSIVTFCGEIFSELLSGYLADEFGRVLVLKMSGFLGGFGFIMYEIIKDRHWSKSIFIFMTSFGFSGTFNVIYIYSPEVFPTTIRSTVMGFLYFLSRFGALLVPAISPLIPHNAILFGILSIISGYASMYLDETLGKELEDDIPESKRQTSFLSPSSSKRKISNTSMKSLVRRTIVSDAYFKVSIH